MDLRQQLLEIGEVVGYKNTNEKLLPRTDMDPAFFGKLKRTNKKKKKKKKKRRRLKKLSQRLRSKVGSLTKRKNNRRASRTHRR